MSRPEFTTPADRAARSPGRGVLHGAVTFGAAAILQRATPFLLLPLFTRILQPGEFGQVGVLTTIAAAITVIASMGMESAIFRGYIQAASSQGGPRVFVSSVGAFGVLAPLGIAVLFSLTAATWVAGIFDVPASAVRFAAVGAALGASSTLVPLALLRAQERLAEYLRLTGLQVVVTPSLTVIFVAVLQWGVSGWMLAYLIGNLVLLVRGLMMIRADWTSDVRIAPLRAALGFGLPLLPHAMAHWALAVSDRAILGLYVSTPDIGAYYVAYVLSLPITLVAVSISQATQPTYVRALDSPKHGGELSRLITAHVLVVCLVTAAVITLGPPAQRQFIPSSYDAAAALIPWVAAGGGLFGLYLVPMNVTVLAIGRTSRVWGITVSAAAANIILNMLLIPRLGAFAAAVNTTIGYGVLLLGVFLYARRPLQNLVSLEARRIAGGLALIATSSAIALLLTSDDSLIGFLVRCLLLLGTAVVLLVASVGTSAQRALAALRTAVGMGFRQ